MLLVEVEARLARLDLTTDGRRYAAPGPVDLGKILGDRADRPVLLDQCADDIVEWLQHALVNLNVPIAMGHDVVAGAGLGFGGGGQLVLLALGGDVVDMNLHLVLLAPFVAELGQRVVGAGYPMVPAAQGQLAGGVCAPHVGRGQHRGRAECRSPESGTTGYVGAFHFSPPWLPAYPSVALKICAMRHRRLRINEALQSSN